MPHFDLLSYLIASSNIYDGIIMIQTPSTELERKFYDSMVRIVILCEYPSPPVFHVKHHSETISKILSSLQSKLKVPLIGCIVRQADEKNNYYYNLQLHGEWEGYQPCMQCSYIDKFLHKRVRSISIEFCITDLLNLLCKEARCGYANDVQH